ncbi:MAG: hypothetical protein A2Z21_02105 [Candidatus Fraserbacteria bacterium RBG_16_55_9]|uniref:Calcineurin-like phosphoesterase domain-containing protein n=1 Tax=Fraserbacteria sp. (strain RBG_16_55_9) TaxID=1817864 RepID=A0A1F5V1B3_FRAXR|nr:MAG: hypothetical protein A2Z21_02105 [Candidatus Fraserbacteria bacterium RBG_16_55_9]
MNTMRIEGGLELIDLALFVPAHRTLVIADIHLGFEEALHQDGALVPRGHFRELMARLERILSQVSTKPERPLDRVVINGDLSHRFGYLSAQEWKESREFLQQLLEFGHGVIMLEGNHDGNLNALAEGLERVTVHRSYELGDLLFLHGHTAPASLSSHIQAIVMGHEHPAVGLRDGVTGRVELYKCFLVGRYLDRRLVVQPSFNPWAQGSDLMQERCLSPLLSEEALGEFEVYPVSDEGSIYRFGALRKILAAGSHIGG